MNKYYTIKQEEIRQKAIDFLEKDNKKSFSYNELADFYNDIEKQAKKYGLYKEFRENGIL